MSGLALVVCPSSEEEDKLLAGTGAAALWSSVISSFSGGCILRSGPKLVICLSSEVEDDIPAAGTTVAALSSSVIKGGSSPRSGPDCLSSKEGKLEAAVHCSSVIVSSARGTLLVVETALGGREGVWLGCEWVWFGGDSDSAGGGVVSVSN